MTQEDKDLLLKDLCGRLQYAVKVKIGNYLYIVKGINKQINDEGECSYHVCSYGLSPVEIEFCKPYLFPLSSMTEEQHKEFYDKYCWNDGGDNFEIDSCSHYYALEKFDWLDKNHFDYRGLIPKGLAEDATNKNIYHANNRI